MATKKSESGGENSPTIKKQTVKFSRLFSVESSTNSERFYTYDISPPPRYEYTLCDKEFLIKITQLLVAVVCAGLYSNGLKVMQQDSITSLMFPNVVFSAFIIITSVIAMSYVLGQVMPAVLIRIFGSIAVILYFVSACITGITWYLTARFLKEPENMVAAKMLIGQAVLSIFNCFLYSYDLYLSIKTTLEFLSEDL